MDGRDTPALKPGDRLRVGESAIGGGRAGRRSHPAGRGRLPHRVVRAAADRDRRQRSRRWRRPRDACPGTDPRGRGLRCAQVVHARAGTDSSADEPARRTAPPYARQPRTARATPTPTPTPPTPTPAARTGGRDRTRRGRTRPAKAVAPRRRRRWSPRPCAPRRCPASASHRRRSCRPPLLRRPSRLPPSTKFRVKYRFDGQRLPRRGPRAGSERRRRAQGHGGPVDPGRARGGVRRGAFGLVPGGERDASRSRGRPGAEGHDSRRAARGNGGRGSRTP